MSRRRGYWVTEHGTPPQYAAHAARAAAALARAIDRAQILYHGGDLQIDPQDRPLFLTTDRDGADWFVTERGGYLWEVEKPENLRAATLDQLLAVGDAVGATEADIAKHSPYQGTNAVDLIYIPKVRRALEKAGCNAVITWDTLENTEIPAVVVWGMSVKARRIA